MATLFPLIVELVVDASPPGNEDHAGKCKPVGPSLKGLVIQHEQKFTESLEHSAMVALSAVGHGVFHDGFTSQATGRSYR